MKLQCAVSAVVDWRINSALEELWYVCDVAELHIPSALYFMSLTVRSCDFWINELAKIDSCLNIYFTAVAFLHVARRLAKNCISDKLMDVLSTIVGQFVFKGRYSNQLSSVLSLSQAAKLMKVVVNNSRSTVQLIEIELSKAYLYRALRCKDSDSDSIYCLANVYLAVLYYTTGQYQTVIDHCTLVMRSQDHSQCSSRSHVVQGELLPKIDDNIDNVLGLAVFYQCVRTAALNQQQTQHVSVFTTELFAHYLHMRCVSVLKCLQLKQMSFTDEVMLCMKSILHFKQPFIADLFYVKLTKMFVQQRHDKSQTEHRRKLTTNTVELDTSELVNLLQQSAVEHLATFRELQAQKFGSIAAIVTTDFEALYAYKRGDYQRCLQLSTQNVRLQTLLLNTLYIPGIRSYPEFIQLLDDDIVSLTAMTLIAYPSVNIRQAYFYVSQHHSADSVAVSDDSMSVEATSFSDVTGSDTRLH